MTLLDETRERVSRLPRGTKLTEIAEECGVSVAWLSRFIRGQIDNPGVKQIDALLTYLRTREG